MRDAACGGTKKVTEPTGWPKSLKTTLRDKYNEGISPQRGRPMVNPRRRPVMITAISKRRRRQRRDDHLQRRPSGKAADTASPRKTPQVYIEPGCSRGKARCPPSGSKSAIWAFLQVICSSRLDVQCPLGLCFVVSREDDDHGQRSEHESVTEGVGRGK